MQIPEHGLSRTEVLSRLDGFRVADTSGRDGKCFSNVFLASEEARELAEEAYRMYLWENGLDPTLYPSLVRLENEIVAMSSAHLRGDEEVVGNFTSGGTESVLLAVKTARDWARTNRGVQEPEMILPVTAHPCFYKAAHYFQVKPVTVPVDPVTFKADVDAMRRAVTSETVLMAASAPSYAHGVVDPIPEIGELALEKGLLFHVDGCIGAFLLPYFRRLGKEVTDFDFQVPGVTSISMDFHKYALAPKGASVVLYRNAEIRRHQIFSWSGWPGYTLVNHTMQSSKSGGPLAGTWAMLNHFGMEGYLGEAGKLLEGTERILEGIEAMDDIYVLGRPEMSLVAISSDTIPVFRLCDEMEKLGWRMYPQTGIGDLKESLHLTLLPRNVDWIDTWLADLLRCTQALREEPVQGKEEGLGEILKGLDLEKLTDPEIDGLLEMAGLGSGDLPSGMAEINEVLNELPPATTDRILKAYYNRLFRYR